MNEVPRSAQAQAERSVRHLLANPNFLFIWMTGTLSGVVRWLQLLVLGIYTYETTGSPFLVSLVPMIYLAPLALIGPIMGVIAERVDRKLLLSTGLVLITLMCVITAVKAQSSGLPFGVIAVFAFLSGIFWTTDMPVRRRLLGDMAGGSLAAAMGLDSATNNATRMAGPLLGGVMLQVFSISGVFYFSATVFLLCLVLVLSAKLPTNVARTSSTYFIRELMAGIRYVRGNPRLRRLFAITIVFNIWGFSFTSMIPVIGVSNLGLSPFLVGMMSGTEGLGACVGAVIIAIVARPHMFFPIYLGGSIMYLCLVGYLGMLAAVSGGPHHSFVACSVTLVCLGMGSACFATMQGTLTYLNAAPEYRSRVLGVLTLCIGTGPIGFFNIGWMAEAFGAPTALMISSVEGLVALVFLWAFSRDPERGDEIQTSAT